MVNDKPSDSEKVISPFLFKLSKWEPKLSSNVSKNDEPNAGSGEQSLDVNGLQVLAEAVLRNNVDAMAASVLNLMVYYVCVVENR